VQIIRSGNGISHAEEIDDKSEIFQIWFDPDLSKSLQKEASYDDYSSDDFKVIELENKTKKIIKGDGSPMEMDSENIFINEFNLKDGNHILEINKGFIHSFFVIEGSLINQKNKLEKGTFFIVDNEDELIFNSSRNAKIFEIISPINPSYQTYSQLR
jgi:redox-sensitive bicupin YhaK (pirin superfamily)